MPPAQAIVAAVAAMDAVASAAAPAGKEEETEHVAEEAGGFTVRVLGPGGPLGLVIVRREVAISELKTNIAKQMGIPQELQRLIRDTEELSSDHLVCNLHPAEEVGADLEVLLVRTRPQLKTIEDQ